MENKYRWKKGGDKSTKEDIEKEGINYYAPSNSTVTASNHHQKYKKFWEELITCYSLIRHEPHRRRHVQHFSVVACVSIAAVLCLPSRCIATIRGNTQTHREQGCLISLPLMFLKIRKVAKNWFQKLQCRFHCTGSLVSL
jgi:hypothetical protein